MITSYSVSSIDNINEDSAVLRVKIRVYWPPRVEYYPILFNVCGVWSASDMFTQAMVAPERVA